MNLTPSANSTEKYAIIPLDHLTQTLSQHVLLYSSVSFHCQFSAVGETSCRVSCSSGQSMGTWELSCCRMWETASLPQDQVDTQPAGVLQQEGFSVDSIHGVCAAALEIKEAFKFSSPTWNFTCAACCTCYFWNKSAVTVNTSCEVKATTSKHFL